jgi:4-hydroxybenzoate polyprenyltransferase
MLAGAPAAAAMPVAIAFTFVLSREVIKSAEDVDGDAPSGVSTIAVVMGEDRARAIAATMMLVLAMLIPVPAIVGHYGPGYFWPMEGLVVPSLMVSSLIVIRNPSRRTFNRASWILKAGMFFGIVGIALARL